jgi:glyoxylate/hydroxypyruvate reductase A
MALLVIGNKRIEEFAAEIARRDPSIDLRVWPDRTGRLEDIRWALAWGPPPGALATVPNLELIVSVGAGVDHLMGDPALPSVPVVRYVDPDLTGRMVEYVTLHVLFHQRRMCEAIELQRASTWQYVPEPAAHEVRVGMMGLGVMGAASLQALAALGYPLRGWSRTLRSIPGVTCFAGEAGLAEFLAETDILVSVLPLTPQTRGLIDRRLLQGLSRRGRHPRLPGPVLINAGRGGVQKGDDILAALDAGELYAASLDVFEVEPLAKESRFWQHPRVLVTPHNAAESTPEAIVAYLLATVARQRRGEPLENVVDRARGY